MLIQDNLYKETKMSFFKTLAYLKEDNLARMRFMHKKLTFFNKFFSFFSPGMSATTIYRLMHYFYLKKLRIISWMLQILNVVLFGCEISPYSEIGPGLWIVHPVGMMIHAKIGKNAVLFGHNGIGGRGDLAVDKGWLGGPVIGDNFSIAYNACVLGYVEIGSDVFVGAMSMVTKSVPSGACVVGIPAKISNIKNPFVRPAVFTKEGA